MSIIQIHKSLMQISFIPCVTNFSLISFFSIAVHPNKLLVASGQAAGHDAREGRVSYSKILCAQ